MCGTNSHRNKSYKRRSHRHHGLRGLTSTSHYTDSYIVAEKETKILINDSLYCYNCGFTKNTDDSTYCIQCGTELLVCPISKMKFNYDDEVVQCTNCKFVFHKHHLDNWMTTKQSCPVCKKPAKQMTVGIMGKDEILV